MRAVCIEHEEHEGLGMLRPALEAQGFTVVRRFRAVERADVDAELVIVMGGAMGVYDAPTHPFLGHELSLLSERLAADRPCLGICLGAQLLARAAGAEVFPGKNGLEVGVGAVRWTEDGLVDAVTAGAGKRTVVAHWHGDTYERISGATLLASTDRYTQQAFRLGKSYGFQFHLELTDEDLNRWFDTGRAELEAKGKDVDKLREELPKLAAAIPTLRGVIDRLAMHFAKSAGARVGR